MDTLNTELNDLQTLAGKLTPEQRRQVAAELGIDKAAAVWTAEAALKLARRRHEGKQNSLTVAQRQYAEIEQAERQTFEARLVTLRKPLSAAEHDFAEVEQVLAAAEHDLAEAVAAEARQTA